jgi:hypothetical protein
MNDSEDDTPIQQSLRDGADTREDLIKIAATLREQFGFDAVQILATEIVAIDGDPATRVHFAGSGNLYARYGAAKCYVERIQNDVMKEG